MNAQSRPDLKGSPIPGAAGDAVVRLEIATLPAKATEDVTAALAMLSTAAR